MDHERDNAVSTGIIALWAVPRSRSTALFRFMLEYHDILALHEPFCNIDDYGETTVDGREIRDQIALIDRLLALSRKRMVFFKDCTDRGRHDVIVDRRLLVEARHSFLVRSPDEVVASFYAIKPDMVAYEAGFENMYTLYRAVVAAGAQRPVVIDSADLVNDPEQTLTAYCHAVGLPFRAHALHWASGPRKEWQRSQRWHADVSASSGFVKPGKRYESAASNSTLAEFAARNEPFYQLLCEQKLSITPKG